jgi:hypothetical protein
LKALDVQFRVASTTCTVIDCDNVAINGGLDVKPNEDIVQHILVLMVIGFGHDVGGVGGW